MATAQLALSTDKEAAPDRVAMPARLLSIDALRGVAAVGVMIYHVIHFGVLAPAYRAQWPYLDFVALLPFSYGFTGVYLFFVISGFCIHLRWARAQARGDRNFKLAFTTFWKRRITRLYPAYLAAIICYLGLLWATGKLLLNSFFAYDLLSHLFLLHNWDRRTVYSINGPFWTLAIEEQLYLAYFLLLWLRRRWGWRRTLLFCLAARYFMYGLMVAVAQFSDFELPFAEAALSNWFVWALGAVSVEAYYGLVKLPPWLSSGRRAAAFLLGVMVLHYSDRFAPETGQYTKFLKLVLQPLWGIGFFLLVNYVVSGKWQESVGRFWQKAVSVAAGVGLFSYSLYLMHDFVLAVTPGPALVKIVACLFFAWGFYRLFERPFMHTQRQTLHDRRQA